LSLVIPVAVEDLHPVGWRKGPLAMVAPVKGTWVGMGIMKTLTYILVSCIRTQAGV